MLQDLDTCEACRQRVRRAQHLTARLRVATTRLGEAEQEGIWATVAAHHAGLLIRQMAAHHRPDESRRRCVRRRPAASPGVEGASDATDR